MKRFTLLSLVFMICWNISVQQVTKTIDGIRSIFENGYVQVARQDKSLSGDIIIPNCIM